MELTLPLTIDDYHNDIRVWKSNIDLVEDEMRFLKNLTQSYVFEPSTPNLFERLAIFKIAIEKINLSLNNLRTALSEHDREISGMLECDTVSCDIYFKEKHIQIRENYRQFIVSYNELKREIFNYCGGILKSHKE